MRESPPSPSIKPVPSQYGFDLSHSDFTYGQCSPGYEIESKIESNESGPKKLSLHDSISFRALSGLHNSQPDFEIKKDSAHSNDISSSTLKIGLGKSDPSQYSPDGDLSPGNRAVGHLGLEPRIKILESGSLSDRDRNSIISMVPPT